MELAVQTVLITFLNFYCHSPLTYNKAEAPCVGRSRIPTLNEGTAQPPTQKASVPIIVRVWNTEDSKVT